MPKAKKSKGERLLIEEKMKALQKFMDSFHSQFEEFESRMNSMCEETCTKIRKMYTDRLQKLPENVRNMTLTEYLEMVKQAEMMEMQKQRQTEESSLRSEYEKTKLESEKKKTLKKNRMERKRSVSASACSASKTFLSTMSNRSRVFSESCLNTPLGKVSVAPSYAVTPKFNPKAPISKFCMRRPRAGELVMSLSGSPLHNVVDDIPDKPGVAVSLGGGKIIQITEDTEIAKLENDFLKKLDEETKSTLANVKEKLDRILKS